MVELTHISLFSGIGGIDIAAEWAGFKTVCFVEIDKYCQKVLRKHWPNTPIIERVQDVTKERIQEIMENSRCQYDEGQLLQREYEKASKERTTVTLERPDSTPRNSGVTLISGGFPCQPHSVAGKREGALDERNLWPEFRRVIGEIRPRWVMAENVPGIFSSDAGRFFGTILNDLAEMGYFTGWATYGAVDVGALHRRNRVFIVGWNTESYGGNKVGEVQERETTIPGGIGETLAYSAQRQDNGRERGNVEGEASKGRCFHATPDPSSQDVADTNGERLQGHGGLSECGGQWLTWQGDTALKEIWESEPNVGRVAHGIPSRVDRLKCLGNAVVPQQIYPILKAIVDIEESR